MCLHPVPTFNYDLGGNDSHFKDTLIYIREGNYLHNVFGTENFLALLYVPLSIKISLTFDLSFLCIANLFSISLVHFSSSSLTISTFCSISHTLYLMFRVFSYHVLFFFQVCSPTTQSLPAEMNI